MLLKGNMPKRRAKKFIKYKLLLDEGMPPRNRYPNINRVYDLKHITHDFGLSGISDKKVYEKAVIESRILLVFNTKHFRKLLTKNGPSIIAISQNMNNTDVDLKILKVLKGVDKSKLMCGYLILVSKNEIKFIKK